MTDIEPNLTDRISDEFICTWGDKKELCKLEVISAIEWGLGAEANPYKVDSWPWKWWNEFYLDLSEESIIR